MRLADRDAATAAMQVFLLVEHDFAVEIAKRVGRSSEDFEVRTAAYGAVGVFRAALRAALVVGITSYMTFLVDGGMQRLRAPLNLCPQPPSAALKTQHARPTALDAVKTRNEQ